jgi:hypothetical protein
VSQHYDTVVKPALNALTREWHSEDSSWERVRAKIDKAAAAGASKIDLINAVGGTDCWNAIVKGLRARGLVGDPKGGA